VAGAVAVGLVVRRQAWWVKLAVVVAEGRVLNALSGRAT
jgi:hypothetical protein